MAHDELSASAPQPPLVTTTRFRARAAHDGGANNAAQSLLPGANGKKRQGSGARLNDSTRLEIIALLNAPEPLSLRKIAKQFGVVEATIRHVRDRASVITSRALGVSEDVRLATRRVVQKTFPELEEQLASWLRANSYDPSDLDASMSEFVTRKATDLAAHLGIAAHEFSASKVWLKNFQRRCAARAAAATAAATAIALDSAQVEHTPSPATVSPLSSCEDAAAAVVTPTVLTKRKRGAGPRLSDSQRLAIIELLSQRDAPSNRKLADAFSVDEATIRHIKANAAAIQQRALSLPIDVRQTTFRAGRTKFAELEAILAEWIDASRRCREEIPPSVVRRRAEEVAAELEIPQGDFRASLSWYASFCRRRGLGPVAPISDLEAIVAGYDPRNVFTVDETGLFYRLLPRADALLPAADSLERVTLVLCCNATGTERLPLCMVAKDLPPPAVTVPQSAGTWPLPCIEQSKAWIDAQVFSKWFDQVFAPFVSQRQVLASDTDRVSTNSANKVLLLLDTAPGHPVSFTTGDIRVLALHAASASWVPPLENGVMTALKTRYKLRVLRDVLAYDALPTHVQHALAAGADHVRSGSAGLFFGRAPHLLDAAQRLADAWAELSPELLRCAFEDANFVSQLRAKYDPAAAARVEAQELALEQDMLALLRRFHRRQSLSDRRDGADVSDAALADELQTFLHLDDESSPFYHKCIVDEVDGVAGDSSGDWSEANGGSGGSGGGSGRGESASVNAMHRILNGATTPTGTPSSVPSPAVPIVTEADVFTQATLLGLQLRQLQATRTEDSPQIENAVRALDNLRRELHAAASSSNGDGDAVVWMQQQQQQARGFGL